MAAKFKTTVDVTEKVPDKDIHEARVTAALGYLFFFIPLVFHKGNCFARFHCNQSIINLLLSTIGAVSLSLIPYAGPFFLVLQELICLAVSVRGIYLAARGYARGIPLVGWITILRY